VQLPDQLDLDGDDGDRLGGQQHGRGEQGGRRHPLDGGHPAAGRSDAGGDPRRVAHQPLGQLFAVEAVEVALQGVQIAHLDVRDDVTDRVGDPAHRLLGLEQVLDAVLAGLAAYQPAQQPSPPGRFDVLLR
jgi:hypothetical protein